VDLRTFWRIIALQAARTGKTPRAICEALLLTQYSMSIENGRTVVETTDAGGSTRFGLPGSLNASEIAALASAALDHIDVSGSTLPQAVRRLRPTFDRASL